MSAAPSIKPKMNAVVIWYDRMLGYGYLAVHGYPADLFLHAKWIRRSDIDPTALLKGTRLLCNVGEHRGRHCAVDLELDTGDEKK